MTKQEIFDKIVTSLRKQNCKSLSAVTNVCMYRGENNTKCAAGFLIPDDQYTPALENKTVYNSAISNILIPIIGEQNLSFVSSLQEIHDIRKMEDWEIHWQRLAIEHNLVYTPKNDGTTNI